MGSWAPPVLQFLVTKKSTRCWQDGHGSAEKGHPAISAGASCCLGTTDLQIDASKAPTGMFCYAAQRADEIGKVEPKVAYYCRMYAVEQVGPVTGHLA